jgi:hypothetical protein
MMLARASAPERTSRWSAGGRVSVYQSESDKGRIKTPARGGELSRSMNNTTILSLLVLPNAAASPQSYAILLQGQFIAG